MFEEFSKRNKAVRAALELAAEGGWSAVTFAAIADRTGLSLADLRRDFTCKTDLLRAFQSEVDAEVLAKAKPARRFRAGPARPRVRHDHDALRGDGAVQAGASPHLQRLSAAIRRKPRRSFHRRSPRNIGCSPAPAPSSTVLVLAFASRVLRRSTPKCFASGSTTSSPGLDRTMAALDRRLKAGEEWLSRVESTCESLCRFACGFMPRGWKRRDAGDKAAEPAAGAASANPAGA